MTPAVQSFWVLLYPNGDWWCDRPIFDGDLAQRTADTWNRTLPRGERDRLRVVKMRLESTAE